MNYDQHLKKLRTTYGRVTPLQRIKMAEERIDVADCDPNLLVHYIVAVESLARTLAVYMSAGSKKDIPSGYKRFKAVGIVDLIEKTICPKLKKDPESIFGEINWKNLKYANQYRNLLIHECIFIDKAVSSVMINTAKEAFEVLKLLSGPAIF
jgi:hypothetical protein